jgi:hypothetical protein
MNNMDKNLADFEAAQIELENPDNDVIRHLLIDFCRRIYEEVMQNGTKEQKVIVTLWGIPRQ